MKMCMTHFFEAPLTFLASRLLVRILSFSRSSSLCEVRRLRSPRPECVAARGFLQQRLERSSSCYDRAGFYGYHVAEHHGTPLGMAPSPSVFFAAVARQTRAPALRTAGLSAAALSSDSAGGRDRDARPARPRTARRRRRPRPLADRAGESTASTSTSRKRSSMRSLDIVRGKPLDRAGSTFAGRHFRFDDVPLAMRPCRRRIRRSGTGSGASESVERCVARGFNVVTLNRARRPRRSRERFRAAAARAERPDLLIGICRFVVVAETATEALATARGGPIRSGIASFIHLFVDARRAPGLERGPATSTRWPRPASRLPASAEEVAAALRAQLEQTGANYCVGQFVFGDMTLDESRRSIELFAHGVMPAIESELSPRLERGHHGKRQSHCGALHRSAENRSGRARFTIADHIVVDAEKLRSGRMYVGDEFRAVVLTLTPGQAQDGAHAPGDRRTPGSSFRAAAK